MDDVIGTKIGVLFGLLVATTICGLLPLVCICRPTRHTEQIISFCNCFAGGVFLSTFLLHMLPEASETLVAALEDYNIHSQFPLSQFLAALGFFIILIVELLAHRFYRPITRTPHSDSRNEVSNPQTEGLLWGYHPNPYGSTSGNTAVEHNSTKAHESILSSLVFLMALSLHSLFEGMAIGLQRSLSGVLEVFIGVILHKCVIVFSFSLSIIYRKTNPRHVALYVVALALMSPIGVAMGIGIPRSLRGADMTSGVLQSVATGTFLFIIFFEILPGELQTHDVNSITFLKLLSMIVGFGIMSGLQFLDRD